MTVLPSHDRRWWKEAVVYQIYPRSFNDTTGDGNGDLPGITARVDYLADLGVDVVWLSPVFDSPMNDNGYDIRDYRAIADVFGTMADFDRMLAALHDRGIRLMMDLVVNHTSSEHRWFEQSRQSKHNPYRDYYHWHAPAADGGPPTNWRSFFSGSAWTFDETTGEYYLHLFDETQPDLKWATPEVRAEIFDMMRFWLDKGVDGFRMDVIPLLSKPPFEDTDDPTRLHDLYGNGPRIHEYLQEMHDRVLSEYDVMTVGEGHAIRKDQVADYAGDDGRALQSFFQFDHVALGRGDENRHKPRDWSLPELKRVLTEWDEAFGEKAWPSIFLGNHDLPRAVSYFGDDRPAYRVRSAKLLATLLLTLRGTPYIYQGDEIGMTNAPFASIDDFRDVETINDVADREAAGADRETLLDHHRQLGRDNARTPMQWTDGPNAGFTEGTPWILVNPNHETINVARARQAPDSVLQYYRRLIALRDAHDVLLYGKYTLLAPDHPTVFAYRRTLGEEEVVVVLNFSDTSERFERPDGLTDQAAALIGTHDDGPPPADPIRLRPYEGCVFASGDKTGASPDPVR
ncbi:MAG: glycoside hydrolase family 13 protein [Salinivenus sp.]